MGFFDMLGAEKAYGQVYNNEVPRRDA